MILNCATKLFAERGYGSTSVRDIVEAAGVTKPTLYYWFENKEALYLGIVRFHLEQLKVLVAGAVDGEGDVRERLKRFVDAYIDGALENRDAVKVLLSLRQPHGGTDPCGQLDMMSLHLQQIEPLVSLIEAGQRSGELRADLNALEAVFAIIGMVNLQILAAMHGFEPPRDSRARLVDLFFYGVASR